MLMTLKMLLQRLSLLSTCVLAGCTTLSSTAEQLTPKTSNALQTTSAPTSTSDIDTASIVVKTQAHPITTSTSADATSKVETNVSLEEDTPLTPLAPEHFENLWDELGAHFELTDLYYPYYKDYEKYYLKRKSYLKRLSKRAKPYLFHIYEAVKERQMPAEIVLLPAVESGFSPTAKSYQSAAGLWQFIPGTAHLYDLHKNWWYDGRMDILHSTQAALDYLQKLYRLNDNDWLLALASYNAGYGNILKAQKKFRRYHPHQKADFWAIRKYLPKETQDYVPQLFAISHLVKHHEKYQIALEPIDNEAYLKPVPLEKQVSLKQVCQITGISPKELKRLNPCYLRPTTPPTGKHHLLLPIDAAETLQKKLSENSQAFRVKWAKHKIKPGESLSTIAHKYHTSMREIKRINGMKSNLIRAGKTLLIPYPEQYAKRIPQIQKQKYQGKKYYHTVKKGESIWQIAKYYNVSNQTLCRWNNIGIRTPLRVGQKLEIRSGQYGKKIHYTLKKNESLWTVAHRYGTTTTQLAKWNHIKHTKVLQPGDKLVIWLPKEQPLPESQRYVVKKGDSVWKIAKNFHLSTHKILKHNGLKKTAYLSPGQVIYIPAGS